MSKDATYTLGEILYERASVVVYRAQDNRDGASILLKTLKPGYASFDRTDELLHEHALLHDLEMPGVIRSHGLVEHDGASALVLEDPGGELLEQLLLGRGRLDLKASLSIAIDLADTLGRIHTRRVIHKDINPRNILVGPDNHITILDFGISTRLPREIQSIKSPNILEGTLAYVSPEQTGRMDHPIDYRTDLYSLGATIYAMLTGRPPFSSNEPMELIYSHIAKKPVSPAGIDPLIPVVLSDMVMKLLSKAVEDRYKSAFGLRVDLEECLRRLDRDGVVEPFPLGRSDVSDRFQIPQHIYGRAREIAALESAFERVTLGTPELVLVSGASGIGKSAVIHELHKALVRRRGFFLTGKFDQLKRDIPYGAVLQAFRELVNYLLAESHDGLGKWRREIRAAAGNAGRVLSDVLPEIELILGPQPPVPELPPADAKNRFLRVFLDFVRVFTERGRPLVLFLDDLQWADPSSLDLIGALLGHRSTGSLLLIGACRDNEELSSPPLMPILESVEAAGCRTTRLSLGPLGLDDVNELIADTLAVPRREVRPLAEFVLRRTQGNPLFISELLTTLYKSGLIALDPRVLRWTWDLAAIERAPITDSVVDLLVARTQALSGRAQDALKLAACINSRFDLTTLAVVSERSVQEVADALEEAVQDGLLVAIDDPLRYSLQSGSRPPESRETPRARSGYRFPHDRVQQAAYSLIPEARRREVHIRIGRLLLQRTPAAELDDRIFDIVDQLNLGAPLIAALEERRDLAELNLRAGKRSKASSAYASAVSYLSAGASLLGQDRFQSDYALARSLQIELAECMCLVGNFDEAERLCFELTSCAESSIDKAAAYSIRMLILSARGQPSDSVEVGLECLKLFGIELPLHPDKAQAEAELQRIRSALAGRRTEELLNLPLLSDPERGAAVSTLAAIYPAAYFTDPYLLEMVVYHIVGISVDHGNTAASALGYAAFGMLLITLGEYQEAYRFGKMACDLVEKHGFFVFKAEVYHTFSATIANWTHPFDMDLEYSRAGIQAAIETGKILYSGVCHVHVVVALLLRGDPLERCHEATAAAMYLTSSTKVLFIADQLFGLSQYILVMRGLAPRSSITSAGDISGDEFEERLKNGVPAVRIFLAVIRLQVQYLFGDHAAAVETAASVKDLLWAAGAQPPLFEHTYYAALAAAAHINEAPVEERQAHRELLAACDERFRLWAVNCPENFFGRHKLLAAEIARIDGKDSEAMRLYDQAIRAFRASGFPHQEGIGNELAGRFYLARDLTTIGDSYIQEARAAYARWGAHGKVLDLEERYPEILKRRPPGLQPTAEGPRKRRPDERATEPPRRPQLMVMSHGTRGESDRPMASASGVFDFPSVIKATQALSSEITIEKLLVRIMSVVVENAGAERGALILKRGQELKVEAEVSAEEGTRILSPPAPVDESRGLAASIIHYVARTQRSVVLQDAAEEGAFTKDAYIAGTRPKSVLCMPLVHQGDVKGVLYLENNLTTGAFTDERAEVLSVLCSQMAISIENAHLYAGLEVVVDERTRALREAQARLIALEKEATEVQMAGGFAHEMRNTLTGAKMLLGRVYIENEGRASLCVENSRKLKEIFLRIKDHTTPEVRAAVAVLLKQLNGNEEVIDTVLGDVGEALERALATTHVILDYARLGRERPGSALVRARPLVEAIVRESEGDFAAHGILVETEIDPDCILVGKQAHYYSIVKNLLLNARDALVENDDQADRIIRIRIEDDPLRCVLRVTDTGGGIPAEHRARIFEPFFSTKPETGTGLGLGVVRKLVALYGGSIEVDSDVGRGTSFCILMPRQDPASRPAPRSTTPPPPL